MIKECYVTQHTYIVYGKFSDENKNMINTRNNTYLQAI